MTEPRQHEHNTIGEKIVPEAKLMPDRPKGANP